MLKVEVKADLLTFGSFARVSLPRTWHRALFVLLAFLLLLLLVLVLLARRWPILLLSSCFRLRPRPLPPAGTGIGSRWNSTVALRHSDFIASSTGSLPSAARRKDPRHISATRIHAELFVSTRNGLDVWSLAPMRRRLCQMGKHFLGNAIMRLKRHETSLVKRQPRHTRALRTRSSELVSAASSKCFGRAWISLFSAQELLLCPLRGQFMLPAHTTRQTHIAETRLFNHLAKHVHQGVRWFCLTMNVKTRQTRKLLLPLSFLPLLGRKLSRCCQHAA